MEKIIDFKGAKRTIEGERRLMSAIILFNNPKTINPRSIVDVIGNELMVDFEIRETGDGVELSLPKIIAKDFGQFEKYLKDMKFGYEIKKYDSIENEK